jgi:hypothetical protein
MAMYVSLFAAGPSDRSMGELSQNAREAVGGRRDRLDWNATTNMLFRFLEPQGAIVRLLDIGLGLVPAVAAISRFDKQADFDECWIEMFKIFRILDDPACMIASDGAVVAYRRSGRIWVADELAFGANLEMILQAAGETFDATPEVMKQFEIQTALVARN